MAFEMFWVFSGGSSEFWPVEAWNFMRNDHASEYGTRFWGHWPNSSICSFSRSWKSSKKHLISSVIDINGVSWWTTTAQICWINVGHLYESVFCRRKTGTATDSRWAAKIGAVMNPVSCRLKLWKDLQRRMSDAMKSARILIFSTDPIMYLHECICFLGRCQLQVTDPRHQEGRGKDLNSFQEHRNVGRLQWVSGSLLRLPTPTAQRFLALSSQGVLRSWWKQLKGEIWD